MTKLSRRVFIAMAAAFVARPSFALTGNQAETLVTSVVKDLNKIIASKKSQSAMIRDFTKLFKRYGNTQVIALRVLGPDARSMSKTELRQYITAFENYMGRKYGRQFEQFVGGRLEIQKTRKVKSWYTVLTKSHLKGQAPFDVSFDVKEGGGQVKFIDMSIEGLSLTKTERAEIGAIFDKAKRDPKAFIARLNKAG
ncbi:MAG: MlaC/ttg2D family ABC transporter substrate-binding protein [Halocynthiibacter sp.]